MKLTKEAIMKHMKKAYRAPQISFSKGSMMLEDKTSEKIELKAKDNGDICAYFNGKEIGTKSKGDFLNFVTTLMKSSDDENPKEEASKEEEED